MYDSRFPRRPISTLFAACGLGLALVACGGEGDATYSIPSSSSSRSGSSGSADGSESSSPGYEPEAPRGSSLSPGLYQGRVVTTIAYFDPWGAFLGQQTTQGGIDVVVTAPKGPIPNVQPEEMEQNPIHLDIAPVAGQTADVGQIEVHSAVSHIVTGESGRRTTLQYWDLDLSGSQITGRLVDPHHREAVVANFLNAYDAIAPGIDIVNFFGMSAGTTLEGTITDDEANLVVRGGVLQGTRTFAATIVATRIR